MSGAFELEGRVNLLDLAQTHLTPSRSVGPPDPDAPQFTWLRGAEPGPAPRLQEMVPALPQAPVQAPTGAPLQEAPTLNAGQLSPQDAILSLAAAGTGLVLLDSGAAFFGGELLQLSEDEAACVLDVVLDAYDRTLRERAQQLRKQYLHTRKGQGQEVPPPSTAGPPLVPEVHRPQEEGSGTAETV